jgi:hypothetical protein
MAQHESLSDRAVSMAAAIMEAETLLRQVNDYGEGTGYCAELDQLQNDALAQLGALRARAYGIKRRFTLAQAEKERAAVGAG